MKPSRASPPQSGAGVGGGGGGGGGGEGKVSDPGRDARHRQSFSEELWEETVTWHDTRVTAVTLGDT
ncbi:hypothetical protein E2C01_061744 [Portunus trituberculatus]|uniref:Uncharacterized protein n=1 Tax=Portunus trituberculatus TaxID=210409 RepID=A0A5B7HF87_PORTR|nr:hypothetical protein [Portunus trituberculatus]